MVPENAAVSTPVAECECYPMRPDGAASGLPIGAPSRLALTRLRLVRQHQVATRPLPRPCVPISHERPHEAPVVLIPHPGGGQRVKCQLSATKPDHSSINVRRRSNRSDRA